jgi:hypothetical protein
MRLRAGVADMATIARFEREASQLDAELGARTD